MADPKGLYGKTYGDIIIAFRASKAVYEPLKTALGLESVSDAERGKALVVAAARGGFRRLGIAYKISTTKMGTGSVWCAPDKFEEASKMSTGKYRDHEIDHAYQPLDTNRA
ncbi:hypothetical protein [Argonema galeatum]|uniref:hypothetical protein n=1 Tax=Argonema galeatum TaxID=2942762 RepID=UPI002011D913|nr:hypothetical protein [Argonema galeatum]MCL1466046.1 hypothetical protein [Argonema galeatum A003/A1]